jgi:hypothetical protein
MGMLKHKAGDTVRIQSQEWIDAHKKYGVRIVSTTGDLAFTESMFRYAGKTAKIITANEKNNCYKLDVDNGEWWWEEWMFDPDYDPAAPLSVKDAILAMVDKGETLYDKDGDSYRFNEQNSSIEYVESEGGYVHMHNMFNWKLHRRPAKRTRPMTQREAIDWARSKESWGWLVRRHENDIWGEWRYPTEFDYSLLAVLKSYQRARLLPDHFGIDEDTIQGFEVEE